MPSAFCFI